MQRLSPRARIGLMGTALVLAFVLGYVARGAMRTELTIYQGDGYVGDDVASFTVGDTTFGFRSSVAWTDRNGTEHPSGWPECLPRLQSVQSVRFGGTVAWHGSSGEAVVLWVDCRD